LEIDKTTSDSETAQGPLATFRIRNFRLLLTGTVLNNAAQWIQQVTLNWLIYNLTGSGTMLGTLNLVRAVAVIGMVPVAGSLIDRFNRRMLMVMVNCALFAITFSLAILLISKHCQIWHVFMFAFLTGLVQCINMNIRQVLVFNLVPRPLIPSAVAIIQTGWSLMRSFGPGIGGFLILWFGPGGNFLIQSGAYLLIAFTIAKIHFPKQDKVTHGPALQSTFEGIRFIAKRRITRTFTLMGTVLPLFIVPIYSVLPPVYAVEVFGDPSGKVLGILMASVGVGGILGGVVTVSLNRMERRGLVQLGALFFMSISLIGFAFGDRLPVALLSLALSGFFEMIFLTTNQTLLQLSIPDHLRGRVTSLVNLNLALFPLGGMVAGIGTDILGGPKLITIALAGVGACIAIGAFWGSPTIRNYRLSKAIQQD
jgi:MFS family permease